MDWNGLSNGALRTRQAGPSEGELAGVPAELRQMIRSLCFQKDEQQVKSIRKGENRNNR